MNCEQNMETEEHRTPIQNYYAGQSVFITGCTGFVGKVVVEKLLRSCPDISKIYLLIRSKKNKSPESRLDEMFENSVNAEKTLYDHVKKEIPDFRKKIVAIKGDIEIENLGLSENDKNILIDKVSIIFHIAANVRFQEKIKSHIQVNVCATNALLSIAKLMSNLKSFLYVSTMYSNFMKHNMKHIEERVYTYPINHKDVIFAHTLSDNIMEQKITRIASQWPNTYTFTKAIAEGLLKDEGGDLPIGIFRPAIISSSASEPLVGWNDNFYGPIGITVYIISGFLRFMIGSPNVPINFVPVDFIGNALITSAWDVFNQCRRGKDMLIYNFVPPVDMPTLGEYFYKTVDLAETYPLPRTQWLPFIIILPRKMLYRICIWLGHLLPALLVDAISICMNHRPRMWKLYRKIHNINNAHAPFITEQWNFSRDNVEAMWNRLNKQDQQLFKFNMNKFDWSKYFLDHLRGIRFYILNEDDSTLEISRVRYKRLYWIHQTFKTVLIFVVVWIIWIILIKVFA